MKIHIRNDEELAEFGGQIRKAVSPAPVRAEDYRYAKTLPEFALQGLILLAEGQNKHNHHLRFGQHDNFMVSVSVTLDVDGDRKFFHMSTAGLDPVAQRNCRVPDEIAHKMATLIAGPGWHEVPHPGTMIPEVRHFLSADL